MQAPAFERERWVLRDRNIYFRTSEEKKRVRRGKGEKEREKKKKKEGRERTKESEERARNYLLDPEIYRENNVPGLTRGP